MRGDTHHGRVESEDGDGEDGVQDAEWDPHVCGSRLSEVQSVHAELT